MFNLRTILNYLLHLKNTAVVFLKNANETNSQEFEDYRSSSYFGLFINSADETNYLIL